MIPAKPALANWFIVRCALAALPWPACSTSCADKASKQQGSWCCASGARRAINRGSGSPSSTIVQASNAANELEGSGLIPRLILDGPRVGTLGSVSSLEQVKFIDFTKARNAAGSHFFFAGSGNNIVDLVTWRIVKSDIFTRAELLSKGITDFPLALGHAGVFIFDPKTNVFAFE